MKSRAKSTIRFKNTFLTDKEPIVQNGLAVTPRQMMELTQRGIPITPANLGLQYKEGVNSLDFDVPMEHQRGIDMADMWMHRQSMKKRLKSKEFQSLVSEEV